MPDIGLVFIGRHGKTAAGDLALRISRRGFYACLGRLDGGLNLAPRDWCARRQFTASQWWITLGPLDLMWTRKQVPGCLT